MDKLKALVIDDEKFSRENIITLIKDHCKKIEVVGEASSAETAKLKIEELQPDVLFLDISMPKESGLQLLEYFPDKNFMVVFTTAHNKYGIQAVKSDAVDYILKPIDITELKSTEKKLLKKWESLKNKSIGFNKSSDRQKIIINHLQGFSILEIDDIIRLEADNNYTKIYVNTNNTILSSKTLKEFENILNGKPFYRIHKSHLINLKYLKEYSNNNGGTVIMSDGSKIMISRRRFQEFLERIKNYSIYIK